MKNTLTANVAVSLLIAAALFPRGTAAAEAPKRPLRIVCTTGMIADIVAQVVGERGKVESLMGPGVDPHLYQPTRNDVARLLRADVVFYNGLFLEGKMAGTLERIGRRRPVFAVTDVLDRSYLSFPEAFEGHPDPHVWMDVTAWKRCTEGVAETLASFDPDGAEQYRANYRRYAETLDRLDAYARRVLGTVPKARRVLITAHDAFHYFGRAYGVEVRGIQGISTESEAGVQDVNRLVELIVRRGVRAVFVETSVPDKHVRSLIEGARARGHKVRIGGRLFSDAMGKPGTYEGTYVGMIDHNATTIARALGGSPPPRGMNGKLSSAPP
ncbi:MAG: manganese transporter [Planctomycetota bacterium]|nr:MAG: manganese transporter [Planctomycetota bacterium]